MQVFILMQVCPIKGFIVHGRSNSCGRVPQLHQTDVETGSGRGIGCLKSHSEGVLEFSPQA